MIAFPEAATETEGRRASQTRLVEGGRYLGIPQNRSSAGRRSTYYEADGVGSWLAGVHGQNTDS
jgi:hypothetical protein